MICTFGGGAKLPPAPILDIKRSEFPPLAGANPSTALVSVTLSVTSGEPTERGTSIDGRTIPGGGSKVSVRVLTSNDTRRWKGLDS